MPLSPEQISLYRRKYGLGGQTGASSTPTSSAPVGDPAQRIQRLKESAQRAEKAVAGQQIRDEGLRSYISQDPSIGDRSGRESPVSKLAGALGEAVIKRPIESLLVKPAVRTGQAIGQLGLEAAAALTDNERIDQARDRGRDLIGKDVETPVGTVEGVKAFGEGGGKQILGEAIESGANIASLALAPGAGRAIATPKTVLGGALKGAKTGSLLGAGYGGAFGVSEGLQKNETAEEIAGRGIKGSLIGAATGGVLGGVTGGVSGFLSGRAARRAELAKLIDEGDLGNKKLAKFDTRTLQKDPRASEALKQGISEADVAVIKTMSKHDRENALKMIKMVERKMANKKSLDRPFDVVGESALEPAKVISKTIKETAKKLDDIATSLKGQTVNKLDDVVAGVNDDLAGIGASVGDEGVNLQGSTLEGIGAEDKIINNVYRRVTGAKDALDLHRIKIYIDNYVDYGKSSGGLTGQAEKMLKGWRRLIDSTLDEQFTDYNKVNSILTETIGQMDDLYQILGRNFKINQPLAEIKAGQIASRILSNSPNRGEVVRTLNNLQSVARKYGYTSQDDIINQVIFADTLEDIFGTMAERGHQGQTERAIEQTFGVGKDLSRGELIKPAVKAVAAGVKKVRGITPEKQINALKALLGASDDFADEAINIVSKAAAKPNMQAGFIANPVANNPLTDNLSPTGRDISDQVTRKTLGMMDMFDAGIKEGAPASGVYKDVANKILTKEMAIHTIDDVAADLTGGVQAHRPKIVEMITRLVDPDNATFQQIADAAKRVRDILIK